MSLVSRLRLLAAALLLASPATAVPAQVSAFRFDAARVPVGRLLEYEKANRDGTRATHISLYVAGPTRLESLKWDASASAATLVAAEMDWSRFSPARLESWALARGAAPTLRATLDGDSAGRGVRLSFAPATLVEIRAWPWHSYDFDFASLNVALAHLRDPATAFTFQRADITYADGGPPFADLGPVRVEFEREELRGATPTRRYRLSGPGIRDSIGTLWSAVADGRIVEYALPIPDEPGYRDVRLRLLAERRMTAAEWEQYKREKIGEDGGKR